MSDYVRKSKPRKAKPKKGKKKGRKRCPACHCNTLVNGSCPCGYTKNPKSVIPISTEDLNMEMAVEMTLLTKAIKDKNTRNKEE